MRKISRTLAAAAFAVAVAGGAYAFLGSPLIPVAQARLHDHPKLEAAFEACKDAKDYLRDAPDDFHGHKVEAMHAIDAAMEKIRACAEDADRGADADDTFVPQPLESHERLRHARKMLHEAREYLHESKAGFHGHREEAVAAMDEAIHHIDRCLEE